MAEGQRLVGGRRPVILPSGSTHCSAQGQRWRPAANSCWSLYIIPSGHRNLVTVPLGNDSSSTIGAICIWWGCQTWCPLHPDARQVNTGDPGRASHSATAPWLQQLIQGSGSPHEVVLNPAPLCWKWGFGCSFVVITMIGEHFWHLKCRGLKHQQCPA